MNSWIQWICWLNTKNHKNSKMYFPASQKTWYSESDKAAIRTNIKYCFPMIFCEWIIKIHKFSASNWAKQILVIVIIAILADIATSGYTIRFTKMSVEVSFTNGRWYPLNYRFKLHKLSLTHSLYLEVFYLAECTHAIGDLGISRSSTNGSFFCPKKSFN